MVSKQGIISPCCWYLIRQNFFEYKMEITKEEFGENIREAVDKLLSSLAEHEDINPDKFYNMVCILENLAFFSPVIYSVLRNTKKI